MFRSTRLTTVGGITLLGLLVLATMLLTGFGISFGEALYLSALGFTALGYSVTEWRLRRER